MAMTSACATMATARRCKTCAGSAICLRLHRSKNLNLKEKRKLFRRMARKKQFRVAKAKVSKLEMMSYGTTEKNRDWQLWRNKKYTTCPACRNVWGVRADEEAPIKECMNDGCRNKVCKACWFFAQCHKCSVYPEMHVCEECKPDEELWSKSCDGGQPNRPETKMGYDQCGVYGGCGGCNNCAVCHDWTRKAEYENEQRAKIPRRRVSREYYRRPVYHEADQYYVDDERPVKHWPRSEDKEREDGSYDSYDGDDSDHTDHSDNSEFSEATAHEIYRRGLEDWVKREFTQEEEEWVSTGYACIGYDRDGSRCIYPTVPDRHRVCGLTFVVPDY